MFRSVRQTVVSQFSLFGLAALLLVSSAFSQQKVYTVAGGYVGDGKPATSAGLNLPTYAAFDSRGDLFISDSNDCRIRRVDSTGKISTVAGTGICGFSGDGGKAVNAALNFPTGLAVDSGGSLFFVDSDNLRVRKITPAGVISTIAGNGTAGYCGDGGPATAGCLNFPNQLAVVGTGANEVVVVADTFNQRIREIVMKTGVISTVAGNGVPGYSGDGGPAQQASLNGPQGVAVNLAAHALFISDSANNVIREVDIQTGIITTLFGQQICGGDPQSLCNPEGLWVDKLGNIFIADTFNARVVELPRGSDTLVLEAGTDNGGGFNGDGLPATSTLLSDPEDVTLDSSGNLVFVDASNARVRRGSGSQLVTTLAGGFVGDGGRGTTAILDVPIGVAFDHTGNLLIADTFYSRIRKVSQRDIISTIAGTGFTGDSGDGGPATDAELHLPFGVAGDSHGNVYVADTFSFAIRKIDSSGTITTFAGNFNPFIIPSELATDAAGNVYDADFSCVIWKFNPNGSGAIVAGVEGECGFGLDGGPATLSALNEPQGVALDSKGNFYIADSQNHRIQVVNKAGIVNTVAGNGSCGFSGDGGLAKDSKLCLPTAVAVDSADNLYIADTENFRIRKVDSSGIITTVAGTGIAGYNGDALPPKQTNLEPESVAVGPGGVIAFDDVASGRVRIIR